MRRLLPLVLLLAACGTDVSYPTEPQASALVPTTQYTVQQTIDGTLYEYGCPDFPCPVNPIYTQQIAQHNFFWMPAGIYPKPTIYLPVLKAPIQLRPITEPPVIKPPVVLPPPPPSLDGPTDLLGRKTSPINQIVCEGFKLRLTSPDGGTWDFANGTIQYQFVVYDANTGTWVPNGINATVGLGATVWNALLNGTVALYPSYGNLEYKATFTANLKRGDTQASVQHTLLCHLASPPPPAPSLDGVSQIVGVRQPKKQVICHDAQLWLNSPDHGPWTFVSGTRTLSWMTYDAQKKKWGLNGQTSATSLSAADWDDLLEGIYDIDPGTTPGPYNTTFTVTVSRGQYQHTLSHTLVCGGPDYFDTQGGS